MIQGVSNSNLSVTQQSLFQNQSSSSTASSNSSSGDSDSAGNVQQQAKVSVLKSSLENQERNTMQLIESSQGIGQNVDTFA